MDKFLTETNMDTFWTETNMDKCWTETNMDNCWTETNMDEPVHLAEVAGLIAATVAQVTELSENIINNWS